MDLGYKLGVGGTVTALRRTQAGPFSLEQVHQLDDLISKGEAAHSAREAQGNEANDLVWADMDALLAPVDTAIAGLAKIELAANSCHYFQQGQVVMDHKVYQVAQEGDKVRVFSHSGDFLGVGEVDSGGCIAPKRLVVM
jgi:tRNA pseudouridine55 synthase